MDIAAGLALFIAFPAAFWLMQQWLQHFAYRAEGIVVGFTLLTVSYHAVSAALANPADALRYE